MALAIALAAQQAPTPPVAVVRMPPAQDLRALDALSEAGRDIVAKEMPIEADRRRAFDARIGAARAAIARAADASPLDLAALRAALEARDAIEADRLRERTRAAMGLLERLSPADRAIVAGIIPGIANPPAPPQAPGAPPLPPPLPRPSGRR